MKRMAWLAGSVALLGGGIAAAVGACGGTTSDPDLNPGPASTAGNNTNNNNSNQGAPDSSTTGGGNTNDGDAGTGYTGDYDSGPPQPPQTTNPGKITCGSSECDAGLLASCCEKDGGATCSNASLCTGGLSLRCDETSDCNPLGPLVPVCCLTTSAFGASASCSDLGCGASGVRLCKTDDECGDGGTVPCNLKTCAGYVLQVCGAPDNCD